MDGTKTRPNWKRGLGIAAYSVALLLIVVGSAAVGWLKSSGVGRGIIDVVNPFDPKKPAEVFMGENGPSDHLTVLILGCDEDLTTGGAKVTNAKARSDMMLVARLDFAHNSISALSIPRDLEFKLDSYDGKVHKMNAFHAYGGDALTTEAVSDLLGIKIDRTSTLDFEAFQDIVDLLGGVTVDVDKDLKYTDRAGGLYIDLKKGPQKLNGYKAMGFVRFRHDDSDFARQERQKQFLMAMKKQLMANWTTIPKVLDKTLALSGKAFTETEFASLLLFSKGVDPKNIKMGMVPVVEEEKSVKLDEDKLPETLITYKFAEAPKATATTPVAGKKNLNRTNRA